MITFRWLLMKGKDDEAECVLARIRCPSRSNSKETKEVFIDLKKSIQGTEEMLKMYTCKSQFRNLFTWRIGQRYYKVSAHNYSSHHYVICYMQGLYRSCYRFTLSNLWELSVVRIYIHITCI